MPKRKTRDLILMGLMAGLAATFAITQGPAIRRAPGALVANPATEIQGAVSAVSANVKGKVTGRHLGFDTYQYPGDEVMRNWRTNSPYEWVGYYLPAPCHKGRTWMGKRERLASMGWGTAVVYVGQQTWDRTPSRYETRYRAVNKTVFVNKTAKRVRKVNGKTHTSYITKKVPVKRTVQVPYRVTFDPSKHGLESCNVNLVTANRGVLEADDAIRRTETEGFPHGSVIFLDIERMQVMPQAMRDYYKAWTKRVLADGRYRPGFYAHKHNAATIFLDAKQEYARAGAPGEPPMWIAGGRDFTPDSRPHEVGHKFAAVWQGILDIAQTWNGHKLPIDVNVAAVPNPSSHEYGITE